MAAGGLESRFQNNALSMTVPSFSLSLFFFVPLLGQGKKHTPGDAEREGCVKAEFFCVITCYSSLIDGMMDLLETESIGTCTYVHAWDMKA